jgi:hypothetical protein
MTEQGYKEITCLLPRGEGAKLTQMLAREKGISSTTVGSARGFSERNDVIREVDLVQVVVEDELANDIFDFIYVELAVGEEHGRLIFQGSLQGASNCAIIAPDDLKAAIPPVV